MSTTPREETIEQLRKRGLKRLSGELLALVNEFRRFVSKARSEAGLLEEGKRGSAFYWCDVLLDGAVDIPNKLSVAIAERDPFKLYYASSSLRYLSKAASDQDYDRFSAKPAFEQTLVELLNTASAITSSMGQLNPDSMESARTALS